MPAITDPKKPTPVAGDAVPTGPHSGSMYDPDPVAAAQNMRFMIEYLQTLHAMGSPVCAALSYQEAIDAVRQDPCDLTRQDALIQCVQLLELCRAYREQVEV